MDIDKANVNTETPPPVTPEVEPTTTVDIDSKSSSKNKSVVLVLVLLTLGLLSLLVYLFYQNTQLRQQVELNELENPVVVTCEYDGQSYEVGEGFTAMDGCNSCSCTETGEVACTATICLDENELAQENLTSNWKAYANNMYSFKYPQELTIDSPNPETESVRVTYLGPKQISSGRTETEVFDGYTFSVVKLVTTNTSSKSMADDDRLVTEGFCKDQVLSDYLVSNVSKVNTLSDDAYQYSVDDCMGSFTNIYIDHDGDLYRITQTYDGDVTTKEVYKKTTDQILSTFEFVE